MAVCVLLLIMHTKGIIEHPFRIEFVLLLCFMYRNAIGSGHVSIYNDGLEFEMLQDFG